MTITVKLFATLRENREKIFPLDLGANATPTDVCTILDIPIETVAIIMVNGRSVQKDSALNDNDVLALFPPVGGG
jgi:molybdopterin converting factor small subunit